MSPPPCASHMARGPLCILTLAARCKQGETAHLRLLTSDYLLVLSEFPFMGELVDYKNARFTTCKIGYVMNLLTVLAQHESSQVMPFCVPYICGCPHCAIEQMMQSLAHALMGHSLICYSCSPSQVTTTYQLDHGIKL